ncbi:MAG: ATP-binding protein [Pseudomonadota bacterium]
MISTLSHHATRASWILFQSLFFVAALLAAFATFIAISDVSPIDPTQGRIAWLLGLNFFIIGCLAVLMIRRYRAIGGSIRRGETDRLARRFLLLFSAAAIIPAAIVAIFLGATITRGLDNWFNGRVDTIVTETAEVARQNFEAFSRAFEADTQVMAIDLNNAAEGLRSESPLYGTYLSAQTALREFSAAYVIDRTGTALFAADGSDGVAYFSPSEGAFIEADEGDAVQTLYERAGLATGLVALRENPGAYLYVYKYFDPGQLVQMRRAEAALADYRAARTRSGRLQWLFAVAYAQLAALVLLLSGRLGLELAGQITRPISRLAAAATDVRDGRLSTRVPLPPVTDELHELSASFNAMTEQLAEQRGALLAAKMEAEQRRQFVETLLGSVSAGVIRTDPNLEVTAANAPACLLLDTETLVGRRLADAVPAFSVHAGAVIASGDPLDINVDLMRGDAVQHMRLKAAQDPTGGCVLTFDDTTRLVLAQRQVAWRDVARRIAHEIRNPLTPIQLSTERLKRRYGQQFRENDDSVFDQCTETILRQVAELGRMVEEFSTFARMPKPSVAAFDLSELVRQVGFAQQMISPDLDVTVTTEPTTVPYMGDDRLLGQALQNLVKNAAEAIARLPEGTDLNGQIAIAVRRQDDGRVVITIDDNGSGLPQADRHRLLEPYVTTREKGTGLGLAIVNRIIADHGGTLRLEDRADGRRGASVQITLPVPESEKNALPETEEPTRLKESQFV